MKKITKLSLVAAVAVAGLTSASAKPLEEAIKNVDVSGSVVYRYDNRGNDKNGESDNANKYKINLNLTSKVNDYVTFNSRVNVAGDNNDFAVLDKQNRNKNKLDPYEHQGEDANPGVAISQAYFGFTGIANTTVTVGKQGLATPYTVATQIDGGEQTGTGALAIFATENYVAGAGYFNQTNFNESDLKTASLDGSTDLYVATLQANFDYINAQAWYLNAVDQFDTYTFVVDGKVQLAEKATLGYEARFVSLDAGDRAKKLGANVKDFDKNTLTKFAVNGKFAMVNARIAYTMTDKKGGITALDKDSQNTSLGWYLSSLDLKDAKHLQLALGADILDNLNFTANYGTLEHKTSTKKVKQEEVYGQLTYKMSKNLSTYLRYGQQKMDKDDSDKKYNAGRIQVAYTF